MAAAVINLPVAAPAWVLTYTGTNITADISAMMIEISFTDHEGHIGNEIEVKLADNQKHWQGPWLPATGDVLNLQMGYAGDALAPCGDFNIDEIELDGPPDTFQIRALAAATTIAQRTPVSAGYEGQTLMQIAQTIAAKHGYGVAAAPNLINVTFARVTQNHETDLAFLKRIAREHNYDFKIDTQPPGAGGGAAKRVLVFYAIPALEAQSPVTTIHRTDVTRFSFKSKTHRTYAAAQVSYQNPATKALVTSTASAAGTAPTADTLKIATRSENAAEASLKAGAALHRHNKRRQESRLTLPGNPRLLAGVVIAVEGFGAFDGNYLVAKAIHRLEREHGYETEAEVRNLAPAGA